MNLLVIQKLKLKANILVVADDENFKNELTQGEKGFVVTDKTTFLC